MKKYILGLLTGMIIMFSISAFAQTIKTQVKMNIYGNDTQIETVNVDGYNYAKVRDLVTAMGEKIDWDADTSTILIVKDSTSGSKTDIDTTQWIEPYKINKAYNIFYTAKGPDINKLAEWNISKNQISTTIKYTVPTNTDNTLITVETSMGPMSIKFYKNTIYFNIDDLRNMGFINQ